MNMSGLKEGPYVPVHRTLWRVLAVWFAALLLWYLYDWAQGRDHIDNSLMSVAAMLLFSVSQLISRGSIVYKILVTAGFLLMAATSLYAGLIHFSRVW
jgi:hypothetical protein